LSTILLLLSPKWLTWKNDFHRCRTGWGRRWSLLALGIGFWVGTFYVIRRVLTYFQSVHELGPALAYQLLLIILLTFLSMLLFSNLITALSAFFLARDLDLLISMPLSQPGFYYSRLLMTAINSSWMVLFFSLPVFAAYGAVFDGGIIFYLWVMLCLPLFLIIPAAFGVLATHLFVYFLPAKRIRDILFFIGLFAFIVIYFLFRFSQPERLLRPESFGHFVQFLTAMETPSSPYLPSSWSAEILAGTLFNRSTDQAFFFALLASYGLFFPLATSWVAGAVYLDGWSKAQESNQGQRKSQWLDRLIDLLTRPFSRVMRAILVKDIKTFMRDTSQWSQVFLLVALIVVYLYNFKVLPLDRSPMPVGILSTLVAFANLALAGFVLSAVAMRFAFPAISLEGNAFWLLQTSPISLRTLLWSKFWLNLLPLLFLGELLVFFSNLMLRVPNWMMILSLVTIFLMTFGITAICVGVGAIYPKFAYDHVAEIPTSFGGAICMIFSIGFIGLIVMIEAWPIYLLTSRSLSSGGSHTSVALLMAPSLMAAIALTVVAVVVPIRKSLKSLEAMRESLGAE
jgi:ABC-2 type transport system permease protein